MSTVDDISALHRIFEPRSIAVVGASANPTKRGHQILGALEESAYAGAVYAVNRGGGSILGRPAYTSVDELPEAADLAVLCTPAAAAPGLVRKCGERGIGGVVVLAVGFGESGEDGARLEGRLRQAGRESGVRIIGPNTSGLLNLPRGVNLIGARGVRPGQIALLVQSGNIALDLMTQVTERSGMGISICCGLGNEVDVGFGEVLDYLGGHDETRVVIAHIEGCRDTRALLRAASAVTRKKPVVAIKSGRTAAGAHAALSHTGAVAGPYDRLSAGLAQAGVVEVRRTDELLPVAEALASQPGGSFGTAVTILSDGGGQSTLAVDALHEMGVPLAELAPQTSARLRKLLGPAAAVRTPVDIAGAADADPGAFAPALEVLAADPGVGVVLLVGLFGGYAIRFSAGLADAESEAARSMTKTMRGLGKGLVVHSQYASHESAALDAFREAHVPVIESLDVACRAVAEVHRRGVSLVRSRWWRPGHEQARITTSPHHVIRAARGEGGTVLDEMEVRAEARRVLAEMDARAEARGVLDEIEARALLGDAGLVFERAEVVRSAGEAAAAVARAGCPVAIKLLSKHISHKSDAGGVGLDVGSAVEARAAFERIAGNAAAYARAHGFPDEDYAAIVSPMLAPPVAELLAGACRDPQLGPVLTIGAGGVWVEVLRDVVHRVLPVDEGEVEAALGELRVSALLAGARGGQAVRVGTIVKAAMAVAECVMRWPDVAEVEVNPLFVYEDRVVPVDARVVLGYGNGT
ncbi:MAG: acetate--CoA ligase family protein [Gemmatimonadota bacterium]|nr:acetate--CoA ligase family protein [Acidobacteriota bacterium]MDE2984939.1 acetate--CoA ligase family protein [Gemmatimonadota bacterium]